MSGSKDEDVELSVIGGDDSIPSTPHDLDTEVIPLTESIDGKNGIGGGGKSKERSCTHPTTVFFHLAFKIGAIIVYLFSNWLLDSFVIAFIIVILMMAADFWFVKNVSGRLLVGLRYSNEIDENGESQWKFESRKEWQSLDPIETKIFWGGLYVATILWIIFALVSLVSLRPQWLTITLICVTLNMANVVGYQKCDKDARAQIEKYAAGMFVRNMVGGGGGQSSNNSASNSV